MPAVVMICSISKSRLTISKYDALHAEAGLGRLLWYKYGGSAHTAVMYQARESSPSIHLYLMCIFCLIGTSDCIVIASLVST